MVVAVDVTDAGVALWSRTPDGVVVDVDREYRPTCYVGGPDDALADLRALLADDPKVAATRFERQFASLRDDERSRVLAVDLYRPGEVTAFAREVRCVREPERWAPGTFRLYDVDLGPKFRYCLDEGIEPTPAADEGEGEGEGEGEAHRPRALSLSLPTPALADGDPTALRCDGEVTRDDEAAVLRAVADRLRERDPDVLVLSSARLVPLLADRAAELGVDLPLGRPAGYPGPDDERPYRRLAGANSYESYGRVGHSPARYDVPGRAIVDRSNSFFWGEGGLPGLVDLVARSHKPLQETAWASIGTVFTAMQIREARRRDVLVPWRAWAAEAFTDADTLHAADRGGFTFEPDVGFHEDVVEVDFASLYPRIMIEHRLSPETVRCECHGSVGADGDGEGAAGESEGEGDAAVVPGLGYAVCPDVDEPFVPSVLQGVVDDRYDFKRRLAATDDPAERERLAAKISALKWILVTCFGYQGYRNSKFGRIEVHESINAHAREILLDAKETLEDAGWRVVHGIVDSLWVTPRESDGRAAGDVGDGDGDGDDGGPDPIDAVCERITDETGIRLEREDDFEWVCFVPARDGRTGALTKYFGAVAGGDEADGDREYKFRGIEARQRSTPAFVADVQEELVAVLDERRDPRAVCDRLARAIGRVRSGDVDPADLAIRTRVSKALEDYDRRGRTVAALERYADRGIERNPGQDVRYVVVDDDRRDRDRVRLPWEAIDACDADHYERLLVRAAESVLSPLGWDRERIRDALRETGDARLSSFVGE